MDKDRRQWTPQKAWSTDYRNAKEGLYDSTARPPPFGHDMLRFFGLEQGYVNLNNGSYGCVPNPVTRFCAELSLKVEANPDRYHRFSFKPLLVEARSSVAKLVGAHVDEVVFVSNATAAVNAVVRNIDWTPDDIIVQTSTSWRSTSRTLQYIADSRPYPTLSTFQLTFPTTHEAILAAWRTYLRGLKKNLAAVVAADPSRRPKIFAVIDSVVANPAAAMPWKQMVAICREEGVLSLVDGAHSLGQELDIGLDDAKPDFWVTTCHKWLFARRGSAVLYVPFRNQHLMRSSLITSTHYVSPKDPHATDQPGNFVLQHEWPGAIEFVSYMCIPTCIEFRKWLGGEEAINEYCRGLAIDGGRRLASAFGTRVMDETPDAQFTLNMTNVGLPLPCGQTSDERVAEIGDFIELSLLKEYNVFAVPFYHNEKWWVRCSVQIFNALSDFDRLGKALTQICREVQMTFFRSAPRPERAPESSNKSARYGSRGGAASSSSGSSSGSSSSSSKESTPNLESRVSSVTREMGSSMPPTPGDEPMGMSPRMVQADVSTPWELESPFSSKGSVSPRAKESAASRRTSTPRTTNSGAVPGYRVKETSPSGNGRKRIGSPMQGSSRFGSPC
ncbi:PLP-dependent transferase [Cylindrobasidium torrendii FP15055 ss-10]|uniref:PLP-dependent transferase n=1 Tax=Cylindrobasidium torrendii FP15055 ss-10 TaxID=1314674 RepID=A0A0D7B0M6_9AGAR|nr:PLP-dependent transferase [Cylindrobasidium torrendii FP15055 ss-10]